MPPIIAPTTAQVVVSGLTCTVPTRAEARLTSTNITGGSAPQPGHDPPGFVTGSCPHHHQRGHLLGNALGGPGTNPNLVTLTEGTNHPVMYAFEEAVCKHVLSAPGQTFRYVVCADYIADQYLGDPLRPGVLGSPYCVFPAPTQLRAYLYDAANQQPLAHRVPTESKASDGGLIIPNGIYKFHEGSVVHTMNNCWSARATTASLRCANATTTGCASARSGPSGFFDQWHYCFACQQVTCGLCGAGSTRAAFMRRTRQCPTCSRPMTLR